MKTFPQPLEAEEEQYLYLQRLKEGDGQAECGGAQYWPGGAYCKKNCREQGNGGFDIHRANWAYQGCDDLRQWKGVKACNLTGTVCGECCIIINAFQVAKDVPVGNGQPCWLGYIRIRWNCFNNILNSCIRGREG